MHKYLPHYEYKPSLSPFEHWPSPSSVAAVAFVTAVYVGWDVVSSVVARRAVNKVLADQEIYEPPSLPIVGHTLELANNKDRFHDWLTEKCLAAGGRPWVLRIIGRPPTLCSRRPKRLKKCSRPTWIFSKRAPTSERSATTFSARGSSVWMATSGGNRDALLATCSP
ncbi:Cytochrome P450 [Phytophthora cactorum]|nr:Cytochrome P450 [Phytophthora cactorum]